MSGSAHQPKENEMDDGFDPGIKPIGLGMPLPTLRELARNVTREPGPDVIDAVAAAAAARRVNRGDDDVYRLHDRVSRDRPDVTLGDVAWVLLNRRTCLKDLLGEDWQRWTGVR